MPLPSLPDRDEAEDLCWCGAPLSRRGCPDCDGGDGPEPERCTSCDEKVIRGPGPCPSCGASDECPSCGGLVSRGDTSCEDCYRADHEDPRDERPEQDFGSDVP